MFGFFKNLLGKPAAAPVPAAPRAATAAPATPKNKAGRFGAAPAVTGAPPGLRKLQQASGLSIDVSVKNILATLPLELQAKVLNSEVGDLTIPVPLERVLPQLSHGTVKISYQELCDAVPAVFEAAPELEATLVPLPLDEILGRINPALIRRRRVQKQITVPDDIHSPFDGRSHHLAGASPEDAAHLATPEPLTKPADNHGRKAPPTPLRKEPQSPAPSRGGLGAAPAAPQPPGIPFSAPTLPPHTRVAGTFGKMPPNAAGPKAAPAVPKLQLTPTPSLPKPPEPAPSIPVPRPPSKQSPAPPTRSPLPATPVAPGTPAAPAQMPSMAAVPTPAAATRPKPQVSVEAGNSGATFSPLLVPLKALAEAWPEAVRKEIVQQNLVESTVALPYETAESALKQGKIAVSWKAVRGWLQPAYTADSPNESLVVELPLKVVAPLFLAKRAEAKPQQKVEIDDNIPNLFFGFPQPDSAPSGATTAKPADTNFYVWNDKSDTVPDAEVETKSPSVGTKFVSKYATPNEIVSRAAVLEGVAGSIIALPDGLLVASRIPADFNGDTLAAFLPQIFGRVSQCTKELRMGDLNNLNFTVGNVPWKIFRVNAIFFAAFGRAGEPLPTAQLAALAAELDHKPK